MGKIVSDKKEVAKILNNYYMDAVENLEVKRYLPNIVIDDENLDEIEKMVKNIKTILVLSRSRRMLSLREDLIFKT